MSGIIDTVGSKSGIVGSDVYPAGHVTNSWYFSETGDGIYLVNATETVTVDAVSWSAISGRKYFISTQISCRPYKGSENNVTIGMSIAAYVGTTARSQGNTAFDTTLGQGYIARNVFGSTTTVGGHMYTHWSPHLSFTAGSTATHYFYISAVGTAGQNARTYNNAVDPWQTIIMEVMP